MPELPENTKKYYSKTDLLEELKLFAGEFCSLNVRTSLRHNDQGLSCTIEITYEMSYSGKIQELAFGTVDKLGLF